MTQHNYPMRITLFLAFFLAFLPTYINAQSCLPNGIWLTNQQEVNDFKFFYPNCKVIEGDLRIFGDDVTDLSPLIGVTEVKGTLDVECPALTSLSGLSNIKTTGGLYLAGNALLTSLAPLSKLTAVNGWFFIQDNPLLTNLNGLQNLKTVGGDFWIHNSPALTNLSALNGLTNIGGEIWFNYATAITDLSGLKNLTSLGGGLNIWWCEQLSSLSGLEKTGTVLDSLVIQGCPKLISLNGLPLLTEIQGNALFIANDTLSDFSALSNLERIGSELRFWGMKNLTTLAGFSKLQSIGGHFVLNSNGKLKDFSGLENLQNIDKQLNIQHYSALESLNGLDNLQTIGGGLRLYLNVKLDNIAALANLKNLGANLYSELNFELKSLAGLQAVDAIHGNLILRNNPKLSSLQGLENIRFITGSLVLDRNNEIIDLKPLSNLTQIGDTLEIRSNDKLSTLSGLNRLPSCDALIVNGNIALINLNGLDSIQTLSSLSITANHVLEDMAALGRLAYIGGNCELISNQNLKDLHGLEQLERVEGRMSLIGNSALNNIAQISQSDLMGKLEITYNQALSQCAIELVCNKLYNNPDSIKIENNGTGCQAPEVVKTKCNNTPVIVEVRAEDGANPQGRLISDLPVQLSGAGQFGITPTDALGSARFDYFNNGPFWLTLPQYPGAHWAAVLDSIQITPIKTGDTIRASFLLKPISSCAQLATNIGLPSAFEDCKQSNLVQIQVRNEGGATAEGTQLAVTLPSAFELLNASPAPVAQASDTLFFDLGKMPALTSSTVQLRVKALCDPKLAQRSICWSAQAQAGNVCPIASGPNIVLSAQCLGNATVRFTLSNKGNAATKTNYQYTIFRDLEAIDNQVFALEAGKTLDIELPADAATYRMEATQNNNGDQTATAIEACNGFTPGLVNSFWQDKGRNGQAYACATFAAPATYSRKTAVPTGEGPTQLLVQNKSIEYTIDFQYISEDSINPDTAHWVLIRDALPEQLDLQSFRPVASSHPYRWRINNDRILEVRFDPIHLPDRRVNPEASRGFFTYRLEQQKDLPKGTVIENLAKVFMDKYSADFPLFAEKYSHTVTGMSGLSKACLAGGIEFQNQSDIDNFVHQYPGCNTIEGDVIISGDLIYDLSKLSQIKAIGGHLMIQNAGQILDVKGLNNLKSVGGDVLIYNVEYLDNIGDLSSLRSIGGSFSISANRSLLALQGPPNLQLVGKNVELAYNRNLNSMAGFGPLRSVNGNLTILECDSLTSLEGLNLIDSIGGNFVLEENDALKNLQGLEKIKYIGGGLDLISNFNMLNVQGLGPVDTLQYLRLENNNALQNLQGLFNLKALKKQLTVGYNTSLTTFSGLENLELIGGDFRVYSNSILPNFQGLDHLRYIGDSLYTEYNPQLVNFSGLNKLDSIGSSFLCISNELLTDFGGLDELRHIGGRYYVANNAALSSFSGLANLRHIGGHFECLANGPFTHFKGLENLRHIGGYFFHDAHTNLDYLDELAFVGGDFYVNPLLENFHGLKKLRHIGGNLSTQGNLKLTDFQGLDSLRYIGGEFRIEDLGTPRFTNLKGLEYLEHIGGNFTLKWVNALKNVNELGNLRFIGGDFGLSYYPEFESLSGLKNLHTIGGHFFLNNLPQLKTIAMPRLDSIGGNFAFEYIDKMISPGLENLRVVDKDFYIRNTRLVSLGSMKKLERIGGHLAIGSNPLLSDCSVAAICKRAGGFDPEMNIYLNASGCNTQSDINSYCKSIPVWAGVFVDENADCQLDAGDVAVPGAMLQIQGGGLPNIKASDHKGQVIFRYFNTGSFTLSLPQLPNGFWDVCRDDSLFFPSGDEDTLRCAFLLNPKVKCPELEVTLALPSNFRGCLVTSDVAVLAQNIGAVALQNARVALVLPSVFEVQSISWPLASQNGDTLFFDIGDLQVFEKQEITLKVNTRCDTFVLGRTLCLEAFGRFANPCPVIPTATSEIKASATCIDDKTLRFALKNIGDAPTMEPHEFRLYRNAGLARIESFQLTAQQSLEIDLAADSATWRLEATKSNNGSLTAVALEGCGGLNPGFITDFWLEKGGPNYDYDCREAIGAYDPNQKTAIPEGHGPQRLLLQDVPLQYTIDFQNTGTDTAYRVLLRDELNGYLDISSFQPLFASHPYSWEIKNGRYLEVLFQPIALPDSNVNEPASHGFFTFSIRPLPLLGDGQTISNIANIIFDYNPPIVTNKVFHTFGRLQVSTDEPAEQPVLWEIWGNPTRDQAIFRSKTELPGEKRFVLSDASGRVLRSDVFSGQMFDFQRDGIKSGLYFFKIECEKGGSYSGRIVVVD